MPPNDDEPITPDEVIRAIDDSLNKMRNRLGDSRPNQQALPVSTLLPAETAAIDEPSRTRKAQEAAEELRLKFTAMLDAGALRRALRRRADEIGKTDIQSSFDDLVNAPSRPKWMTVTGEVSQIIGGGFIGYMVKIATSTSFESQQFFLCLIAGVTLTVISLLFKHKKI